MMEWVVRELEGAERCVTNAFVVVEVGGDLYVKRIGDGKGAIVPVFLHPCNDEERKNIRKILEERGYVKVNC